MSAGRPHFAYVMHHQIRAFTKHIPVRTPADLVNGLVATLGNDRGPPEWLLSHGIDGMPAMVLNVSSPFQRKMFYFPRAYWKRLMGLPFGRFLALEIGPGSVFLDIGSNIGFYTLFAAQRVGPTGVVHAFEPEPTTFESVSRSCRENAFGWVTCHNVALSNRESDLPLFVTEAGSAHSLLPEIREKASRYSGEIPVKVRTLDALVRDGTVAVPRVDLIKIDVEGEEARTVSGMKAALRAWSLPRIWAEVRGPKGSTRAPNTFPAVCDELRPLGYVPHRWEKGKLRPVKEAKIVRREDVLFLPRR